MVLIGAASLASAYRSLNLLLSKIRDCFAPLAMTNPRLEAFSVIARIFFATKQSGFGHRCNYNGLLAILDTNDLNSKVNTQNSASFKPREVL
jgi:hypothetical protein